MKNRNKKDRKRSHQSSGKTKISQAIWEYAGDFIRMGSTPEQRHSFLNAACSAWNIACNPPEVRKRNLDHYMQEFRKFNVGADDKQLAHVRADMEKLIGAKLKMFPHDLRQVLEARIIKVGGQDRIVAVAMSMQ